MVIAYNPGSGFSGLLNSLTAQFKLVLVVDNGDCSATQKILTGVMQPTRVVHVCNGGNIGIGEALNKGLLYAHEHGYTWLLTFDHDSQVGPDFASVLFSASSHFTSVANPIAVIGPVWKRASGDSDFSASIQSDSGRYCPVLSLITSGSCVNVAAAILLGGFREDYFIDSVDHEFCLRAKSIGYEVLLDSHLTMDHCLGDESRHVFLNRNYWVTNHSVVRRYYISRNKILLWCQFFSVFPRWVIRDIKWHSVELMKLLAFEKRKTKKILAVLLGCIHAVTGVRGKLQDRYMGFFGL